jgi:hypothetical protein
MAKIFNKCKLCKAQKFLNFEGLCKRCVKNPASLKIQANVAQHEKDDAKFAEQMRKNEAHGAKEPVEVKAETKTEAPKDDKHKGKDAKSDEKR